MPVLRNHHTFHLNAQCQQLEAFHDASSALSLCDRFSHHYLLGEGSNTVFIEDYDGAVLLNQIKGVEVHDTDYAIQLRVGAGENWHRLVTTALEQGWHGMENLALIPGSVGAAPIQNIGAYGLEVGTFIESVEMVDRTTGNTLILNNEECRFGYRDSIFKQELLGNVIITHVNFVLPKNYQLNTSYGELSALTHPTPHAIYEKVIDVRSNKLPDPATLGNAGSFFKNPVVSAQQFQELQDGYPDIPHFHVGDDVKIPAAWLIDQCGYKGKQVGEVRCHPTQPLVLTNLGGASGNDVVALAREIMTTVTEKFGVSLEPEVRLVGKEGLVAL
ncbi:UDP-N-acetylmuramate dehydrogenase [Salinimonas sp. HHU 13199]|uniref:UDP-N-acetylenolpyruvoylglucosamine reductase n=1 Tax=Salinimonas profundi TaxID=2729140 RepID=A0ABR8LNH6_9ALTE|nr:UDP-N-acetylmuramate dehydrogenase [Salinimonas profundi]MBD3587731.1 UDP-N-acetylmuramate dehydrogenase [Salinimonas profundi]